MQRNRSLPSALQELEEGIRGGLHLGGQLYVSMGGKTIADIAFGEARPGEPMTTEHLMLWMSSTKPILVVALARLWEQGRIELDDPVAEFVPEFSDHGKGSITIRHLLTHTAGIRSLGVGWPEKSWAEIISSIAARKPEPRWTPGARAGYHTQSSWFLLGAVVERLSGAPLAEVLRSEVLEPIGSVDSWVGMPVDRFRSYGERIVPVWDTSKEPAREIGWDSERHVTTCNPAGNGYGPVRELGALYETLLGTGEDSPAPGARHGIRLLDSPTVAAITARHRVGMVDRTFRRRLDWGLGVIINSAHYGESDVPYGYGPHASAATFGHSGARSSTAFADPAHALVIAIAVNGMAEDSAHRERFDRVLARVYEDLELVSPTGE